jgi:hypothetical protein
MSENREEEKKSGDMRRDDWEGYIEDSQTKNESALPSLADGRDFIPREKGKEGTLKVNFSIVTLLRSRLTNYLICTTQDLVSPVVQSDPLQFSEAKQSLEFPSIEVNAQSTSVSSSYPDLSFPSPSRPSSPIHSHFKQRDEREPPRPPSATLSIFDTSLPTRTRLYALASALAINFLLPFVNGVMLGFGEIFARNVVSWIGWNPGWGGRTTTATALGIQATERKRREEKARKDF